MIPLTRWLEQQLIIALDIKLACRLITAKFNILCNVQLISILWLMKASFDKRILSLEIISVFAALIASPKAAILIIRKKEHGMLFNNFQRQTRLNDSTPTFYTNFSRSSRLLLWLECCKNIIQNKTMTDFYPNSICIRPE